MSARQEPAAYVPRVGDRVTVRRYITPTDGERELSAEFAGTATEVTPSGDGYYLSVSGYPYRIFTGYQFLGPGTGVGTGASGPASLVTEVSPADPPVVFSVALSPDLAVAVDASDCIVLVVTDPAAGRVVRRVTVSSVADLKAALGTALQVQRERLDAAERARLIGMGEARRAAGQLNRREAVEWLIARGESRASAVGNVASIARGGAPYLGMTYSGGFWRVPSQQR